MQRPGIKTELFTVSWDSRKWFLPLRTLNWLYLQLMKYLLFFLGEVKFSLPLGRHFWQLHPEYGKVQLFWMGICFFRNALQQSVKKNYRKKEKKKGLFCNVWTTPTTPLQEHDPWGERVYIFLLAFDWAGFLPLPRWKAVVTRGVGCDLQLGQWRGQMGAAPCSGRSITHLSAFLRIRVTRAATCPHTAPRGDTKSLKIKQREESV